MMDKLLPCPFCGKSIERNAAFSTRRQDHYSHPALGDDEEPCMLEHINVVDYFDDRTRQGNVERWNRRTLSPSQRTLGAEPVDKPCGNRGDNDQAR